MAHTTCHMAHLHPSCGGSGGVAGDHDNDYAAILVAIVASINPLSLNPPSPQS